MKTTSMKKLRTKLNSGESLLPFGTESVILFAIKNTISSQLSYNPHFMLKIVDLISLLSAEYGLLYTADKHSDPSHCGTIKLGPQLAVFCVY